jgi:hypothetical protein
MRSKLEPMKRFARTVRQHEPELLNWFKARGRFALGATEGFNNEARITTRKASAFEPTNTHESPCIMRSATYPCPIGSPTSLSEEAHFEAIPHDPSLLRAGSVNPSHPEQHATSIEGTMAPARRLRESMPTRARIAWEISRALAVQKADELDSE